jgi:YidC/Oxa1 family membrane protein insertase
MDRRFVLALLLTGVVVFLTPVLFPTARAPRTVPADSTVAAPAPAPDPRVQSPTAAPQPAAPPTVAVAPPAVDSAALPTLPAVDTAEVAATRSAFRFSSRGASLLDATVANRENLRDTGVVRIVHDGHSLVQYRIVSPRDTVSLASLNFALSRGGTPGAPVLTYRASVDDRQVVIRYTVVPDSHLVHVQATISGGDLAGRFLAVSLPGGLTSFEADTLEDIRQLAYVYRTVRKGSERVNFSKLEPDDRRIAPGPISWAAAKSKYFIVGILAPPNGAPFAEMQLAGAPRTSKEVKEARADLLMPLGAGSVEFDIYAGPQEWRRMLALQRGFEDANPYGGWFSGVVQPFATIVMRVLLWMHDTTSLSYGWVLVIFGLVIRLLMWPLQQRSMRVSIQMQRIQPELQAVQTKYKSDPQKLQQEMMRVYRDHGMSPFSTFSGCLPMLLPMPILFALFFVFQNTIEFRGVPFLWLPDISLKDPYYIVPLLMGVSMFALSWIGMQGAPPNPQAKMMAYIFPPMMTILFLNFASGLNLYYFVQNIAALPQQWLLVRERAKTTPPSTASPPVPARARGSG